MSANPELEVTGSRGLVDWLAANDVSLAVSTYQAGKLFLVGHQPDGRLTLFERTFERAMGLAVIEQSIWMATKFQIWRLENVLDPGVKHGEFDRLYVPRIGYTTGDVDAHDVATTTAEGVVFVSSLLSCVGALSQTRNLRPVWQPPFITKLLPEDRCHLNGIAVRDGCLAYASAVGTTDVADGWRDHRRSGGVVIDVTSNEIVGAGLSMPHSPRWYDGRLWLHNSGSGEFGYVDLDTGQFEPVTFCPGFLRGLAFHRHHAIVGISRERDGRTFSDLRLGQRLVDQGVEARCGVQIIDLRTGAIVQWLRFQGVVAELFDVGVLEHTSRPTLLGFKTPEIQQVIALEEPLR